MALAGRHRHLSATLLTSMASAGSDQTTGGPDPASGSSAALSLGSFDPRLALIASHLTGRGALAYVYGGSVRDALMGRPTSDIDIAISERSLPAGQGIAALLGGTCFQMDPVREISRVVVPGPNPLTVDLTGSLPAADIDRHLRGRDFTVDAMAVSIGELACGVGTVLDPLGGRRDLEAGILRAVSPEALEDDPIRLLRGPRLAATSGLRLDPTTADWIRLRASRIAGASAERVRDEFLKLISASGVTDSLRKLDDLRLLTAIVPELEETRGVVQPPEHHYDVLDHSIETPGALQMLLDGPPDGRIASTMPRFDGMEEYFGQRLADGASRKTILRLTCLLHDIGKAVTRSVDPDGRIRFLDHGERGEEICESLMVRLRFSRRAIAYVTKAVHYHLRPGQVSRPGEMPSPRAIFRYRRDLGDIARDVLYLNLADYIAAKGPPMLAPGYDLDDWREHCAVAAALLSGDDGQSPTPRAAPRLLDGHDIIARFAIAPGPMVGDMLALVEEAHATGEIESREEAIALIGDALESGVGGSRGADSTGLGEG